MGRKLTQWRTERISVGRREVTGAEEVAQALSLKLFSWELPGGCGAMAQYLQDLVVTVSVNPTSCVFSTIRSIGRGELKLPHSGLQFQDTRNPKQPSPYLLISHHHLPSECVEKAYTQAPGHGGPGDRGGVRRAGTHVPVSVHPQGILASGRHCLPRLPCLLTSPSCQHTVLLLFNFAEHRVPTLC